MRNVIRLAKPESLERNASQWKRDLLAKVRECKHNKTEVPEEFYNHYRQDDVKEQLKEMYGELCCYCESRVGVVEFGHIEHRKPKKKFPEDTYDWDNLHLACTRCNVRKGRKYSKRYPILDAVKDRISEHLSYEVDRRGVWPKALKPRGETTIRHVDLTDENLRKNWNGVFFEATGVIFAMKRLGPDGVGVAKVKAELEEMSTGEYGSIVDYARQKIVGEENG